MINTNYTINSSISIDSTISAADTSKNDSLALPHLKNDSVHASSENRVAIQLTNSHGECIESLPIGLTIINNNSMNESITQPTLPIPAHPQSQISLKPNIPIQQIHRKKPRQARTYPMEAYGAYFSPRFPPRSIDYSNQFQDFVHALNDHKEYAPIQIRMVLSEKWNHKPLTVKDKITTFIKNARLNFLMREPVLDFIDREEKEVSRLKYLKTLYGPDFNPIREDTSPVTHNYLTDEEHACLAHLQQNFTEDDLLSSIEIVEVDPS